MCSDSRSQSHLPLATSTRIYFTLAFDIVFFTRKSVFILQQYVNWYENWNIFEMFCSIFFLCCFHFQLRIVSFTTFQRCFNFQINCFFFHHNSSCTLICKSEIVLCLHIWDCLIDHCDVLSHLRKYVDSIIWWVHAVIFVSNFRRAYSPIRPSSRRIQNTSHSHTHHSHTHSL